MPEVEMKSENVFVVHQVEYGATKQLPLQLTVGKAVVNLEGVSSRIQTKSFRDEAWS